MKKEIILKQIKDDKCLICGYSISSMSWSDFNGQRWCPQCGLTYQTIGSKFKEEYLKSIGKTEKDVKVPYCDDEGIIPLVQKYYKLTGKSAGLGCFMSLGQDYKSDGDKSGNVYPKDAYKEFNNWIIKNCEDLEKEFLGVDVGIDWDKAKQKKELKG